MEQGQKIHIWKSKVVRRNIFFYFFPLSPSCFYSSLDRWSQRRLYLLLDFHQKSSNLIFTPTPPPRSRKNWKRNRYYHLSSGSVPQKHILLHNDDFGRFNALISCFVLIPQWRVITREQHCMHNLVIFSILGNRYDMKFKALIPNWLLLKEQCSFRCIYSSMLISHNSYIHFSAGWTPRILLW